MRRSAHLLVSALALSTLGGLTACSDSDDDDEIGVVDTTGTTDATDVADVADTTDAADAADVADVADAADTADTADTTDVVDGSATSTAGVACDYVDVTFNDSPSVQAESRSSWTCSDVARELVANGIPDHAVGTFPNQANPNTITEQDVSVSYTLDPVATDTATELGGPRGSTGLILNGVKIDAGTGGACDDTGEVCSLGDNTVGQWNIEALSQDNFDFGTDENNAHVQPDGAYHYHGMPEGFVALRGGSGDAMTLIGWAADGFPIYARYGHGDPMDAGSALVAVTGSYQLVETVDASRPPVDVLPLGTFLQDWEYVAGSGDLDECNGRTGVTPEFPGGTYHYFATDSYPYLQRCVKGAVEVGGGGGPGGPRPGGATPAGQP